MVGVRAFEKAAEVEAAHPADPSGENPSTATVLKVAAESKAERHTIRWWRKFGSYQRMVDRIRRRNAREE